MIKKKCLSFMNDITYLTPLRIQTNQDFQYFIDTMRSYYDYSITRPKHLFSISMNDEWERKFLEFLDSIQCNYSIISRELNAISAFIDLFESVTTEFVFMMFADVKNLEKQKDILNLAVNGMKKNSKIFQVRLGGVPIGDFDRPEFKTVWRDKGCFPTNTSHFIRNDDSLSLIHDRKCIFKKEEIDDVNSLWISQMIAERMKFFFPVPFWHTVMRTVLVQQFIQQTKRHLKKSDTTISHFLQYGNTTQSIILSTIHLNGWPIGFEFLSEYYHGFLNCACYLYMLGRERKSEEQFYKDHCNEII